LSRASGWSLWPAKVGLTSHSDFNINPAHMPNSYSMLDFTKFVHTVYGLPRHGGEGATTKAAGDHALARGGS
jgi:hypothetical protein